MWRKSDITFPKAYSLPRSSSGCISFAPVSLLRDYMCRLHITYVWGVSCADRAINNVMCYIIVQYCCGLIKTLFWKRSNVSEFNWDLKDQDNIGDFLYSILVRKTPIIQSTTLGFRHANSFDLCAAKAPGNPEEKYYHNSIVRNIVKRGPAFGRRLKNFSAGRVDWPFGSNSCALSFDLILNSTLIIQRPCLLRKHAPVRKTSMVF